MATLCCSEAFSKIGANIRHGPHDDAQKSTNTVSLDDTTSAKLYAQPGALPAHALDDLIGRVRAVDIDDIHRQIAKGAVEQSA